VDRLLLVSSSELGQLVAQHVNAVQAAKTAGVSRIASTSMLKADDATYPRAGEHRDSERALREADVPFTLLGNGLPTEGYTGHLRQYPETGEIVGATGSGRISTATRQDYAAAAAALVQDEEGNRTCELGGPAFGLPQLAHVISAVTGTKGPTVTCQRGSTRTRSSTPTSTRRPLLRSRHRRLDRLWRPETSSQELAAAGTPCHPSPR